ncbi:MAG: sugar ABC transporter permease [Clostridiales bacterium]|jgi:ABC-type sugar transport system permease subunit|nr:sugar ABC transporter permease [Clostridiales bacterium]
MQARRHTNNFQRARLRAGLLFVLPAAVLCLVFVVVPLVEVFVLSFYEWNGISQDRLFVGFNNFAELPSTEGFWDMAKATLLFAVGTTVLVILISFVIALALDNRGSGRLNRGLMRSLWFVPCILSGSVVGIVWRIMYNYNNGVINFIIRSLGMAPVNWLETYGLTNFAVILAAAWSLIGLCVVVFLAGLQSIPTELYEAASIDGAGRFNLRRHVTLPMMAPSITINVLTTSIASFKMYELPWLVSGGLPGYSTRLLTQRIYFFAFQSGRFGIGSALSVLLIILITLISLLQLVVLRRREDVY